MARAKKAASKAAKKKSPAKKPATKKKPAAKKAPAKKAVKKPAAKKAPAKKTAAKKAAKKPATKKAPAKKAGLKKAPAKKAGAKKPAKKKAPAKKPAATKAGARKSAAKKPSASAESAELFIPLSEGERADSLRLLLEDRRLANMAKVGRYRVIATEPLVLKPGHELGNTRIARIVIYDYAADRCVEANINLDRFEVAHLSINNSQPMLASEEQAAAMNIAVADERVNSQLSLGEVPQSAMHYWSRRETELAYSRRSAAVLFGQPGARTNLVVVVDLLDAQVTEVVSADNW